MSDRLSRIIGTEEDKFNCPFYYKIGACRHDETEHFEEFFEEILEEFSKFGEIEEMHVVENLGDHMFGNVYVKYRYDEDAEKCLQAMSGRYYAGRVITGEFSPVTDFREARCRQFDEDICTRGGYCNFMHLKRVPRFLRKMLKKSAKKKKSRRSRSPSVDSSRSFARATSEERRSTIARWNREKVREEKRSEESSKTE